jgi:2-isopropylmalate synthase
VTYELSVYEEHALTSGSSSKAMAYVGIKQDEKMYWGAGTDDDIIKASNFSTVTLTDVATHFNLTTQYTSKLINGMTIERVAKSVGYPTVEHFSRIFKKAYGVNPAKYRQGFEN